jgi:deazaflavin-dependent oxidoreductase (nitroreductase family)
VPGPTEETPYHRLGLWLTRSAPGVMVLRYVFTPLDRAVLKITGGRKSLAPRVIPEMLLHTTGRRSGERRSNPVLFLRDGDRYVVVASNYGRDRHPAWSSNLLADPEAEVQIGARREEVVARRATTREFERYWPRLVEIWPGWNKYRQMTDREFRMFVLEPRMAGRGRPWEDGLDGHGDPSVPDPPA